MDAQADYVEIVALPVWRRGRIAAMTMALFGIAACAYIVTTDAKIFEAQMQNRHGSDLVAEPVAFEEENRSQVLTQVTSEGRMCDASMAKGTCGMHGESYAWCYTGNNMGFEYWDYCVVTGDTSRGSSCIDIAGDDCTLNGEDYTWCWTTEPGNNWDYCVPPVPTPAPTPAPTVVNGFTFYGQGLCTTKDAKWPHYYVDRCSYLDTAGCASLCEQYEWCYFVASRKGYDCLLYIYPDYVSSGTYKFPSYIRGFSNNIGSSNPIFRNDYIVGTDAAGASDSQCYQRNSYETNQAVDPSFQ